MAEAKDSEIEKGEQAEWGGIEEDMEEQDEEEEEQDEEEEEGEEEEEDEDEEEKEDKEKVVQGEDGQVEEEGEQDGEGETEMEEEEDYTFNIQMRDPNERHSAFSPPFELLEASYKSAKKRLQLVEGSFRGAKFMVNVGHWYISFIINLSFMELKFYLTVSWHGQRRWNRLVDLILWN